jgi:hypothetical protein
VVPLDAVIHSVRSGKGAHERTLANGRGFCHGRAMAHGGGETYNPDDWEGRRRALTRYMEAKGVGEDEAWTILLAAWMPGKSVISP